MTLRQAQSWVEELVDADRRKDEFLAMLGHELRNPLGTIKNSVGLLQSEPGQTYAQRKAQALIDRQVRRMMRLVDDLLDVSRIRHGHLHLRRERMDLRAAVSPGGHFKFPHPWPGQNPPLDGGGRVMITR